MRDSESGLSGAVAIGRGITNIDIEVTDTQRGLALIRDVLQTLGVAPSTIIRQSGSPPLEHAAG